jgi:hypothetical protein
MTRATTTQPAQPALAFEPNSWYEALLGERAADRARFEARYSLPTQQAVAAYELAKSRAQQEAQRLADGRKGGTS